MAKTIKEQVGYVDEWYCPKCGRYLIEEEITKKELCTYCGKTAIFGYEEQFDNILKISVSCKNSMANLAWIEENIKDVEIEPFITYRKEFYRLLTNIDAFHDEIYRELDDLWQGTNDMRPGEERS